MLKKAIIKGTVLIAILAVLIFSLNNIMILKGSSKSKFYQGLYNEENKFDVLFMGSSHMLNSVNPNILWGEYGITSYNYGTGGQSLDTTYYLLKEALKVQKPKVVLLDLFYLGLTDDYGNQAYIRSVLDNMKLSSNKLEAIKNCTPKDLRLTYLMPMLKFHTRWKELTEDDFNVDLTAYYYTKGFGGVTDKYGVENKSNFDVTEVGVIPQKAEEYLYKFIELSKEYNFDLVFINAPYDYTSTAESENWVKSDLAILNRASEIAEENNIPFINYSTKEKLEEINFDFPNDMNDIGHCNIWGANKVSYNLANYLHKNYNLEDYRGKKGYEDWEDGYQKYLQSYLESN